MDLTDHDLPTLFEQLGLDGSDAAIDAFVEQHRPLSTDVDLADAPFWNDAQVTFLREAIDEDAQWADAVDTLSTLLRAN